MSKFLDFILYPKRFYEKLNDKTKYLFWGILLIGFIDILLFGMGYNLFLHFIDRPVGDFLLNLFVLSAGMLVVGFLDIFFVSLPLSDLFYRFSTKKDTLKKQSGRILFIKMYICSHFIIAPAGAIISIIFQNINMASGTLLIMIRTIADTAVIIWSSALLTRGTKIIYGYSEKHNSIVFLTLFIWTTVIISRVLYFIISVGLVDLLR